MKRWISAGSATVRVASSNVPLGDRFPRVDTKLVEELRVGAVACEEITELLFPIVLARECRSCQASVPAQSWAQSSRIRAD